MQVETYEEIGLDEQNGQIVNETVNEEALALIDKLNLTGQKSLVKESERGGETVVTRMPYRRMTAEETAVYGALMPRRIVLDEYSDGPIPLRVLQIAAHAVDLFSVVEVWCPGVGEKDPVLVGWQGATRHQWGGVTGGQAFILARWGDVLEDFETLRAKAKVKIAARLKGQIAEGRASLQSFEASLDAALESYLHGNRETPAFLPTLSFAANA